ncbi:MAG: hypothetical protein JJ900_03515 [Rhodospirillales bacterium]|nr:hypothetical protein [Rhodospirillales bacterium]MBO6785894.1 hypothetical protein [Rhodospirillales bacterium]
MVSNFFSRVPSGTALVCAVIAALTIAPITGVIAQGSGIPEHAYATTSDYGKEWACLRGFLERDGKCIPIVVPDNAYLNARGDRWECRRGYRKTRDACELITVPENAFLTKQGYGGTGWTCTRGYVAKGNRCQKIIVPANAFLSDSSFGDGWVCERGYKAVENKCIRLSVPDNAHLGYDGDNWECDKPFVRRGDSCVVK